MTLVIWYYSTITQRCRHTRAMILRKVFVLLYLQPLYDIIHIWYINCIRSTANCCVSYPDPCSSSRTDTWYSSSISIILLWYLHHTYIFQCITNVRAAVLCCSEYQYPPPDYKRKEKQKRYSSESAPLNSTPPSWDISNVIILAVQRYSKQHYHEPGLVAHEEGRKVNTLAVEFF